MKEQIAEIVKLIEKSQEPCNTCEKHVDNRCSLYIGVNFKDILTIKCWRNSDIADQILEICWDVSKKPSKCEGA